MLRWRRGYNAVTCLFVWFQLSMASIEFFHLVVDELKVFDPTSWCDVSVSVKVNIIMINFYRENVRFLSPEITSSRIPLNFLVNEKIRRLIEYSGRFSMVTHINLGSDNNNNNNTLFTIQCTCSYTKK